MKVSLVIRAAACVALGGWFFVATAAQAAPTWDVDLNDVLLQIDTHAFADNGLNGAAPSPGMFVDRSANGDVSDFQANFNASFFGQTAETFDLGAGVNVFGVEEGFDPDFRTTASADGVIGIKGLGTRTLDIFWRANTANTQRDSLNEFYTESTTDLTAQIVATINGVAPGTPVTIGYDWEYLGAAVIDHEAGNEDSTTASGSLSFVDEQGLGPGNLFANVFAEPGPLDGVDDDNDAHTLTTSTTGDPSFLTIDLQGSSDTLMNWPGVPPNGATQDDQASSVFNGRLTLTLPIPEPSSAALMLIGLLTLARFVRRR